MAANDAESSVKFIQLNSVTDMWRILRYKLGKMCQRNNFNMTWCFSDRASWIDYILITNLMHLLLFIHEILFYSTCFEPQVLIFRRMQLYTCSIWYCHSSWWPIGKQHEWEIKLCTDRPPRTVIVPYAACIQLYPPEDEHLRLEICRGD